MNRVDMTRFDPGNCFAASLASILELPISSVPEFEKTMLSNTTNNDIWWGEFNDWLDGIGLYPIPWTQNPEVTLNGYWLACGPSPRDESIFHSVVYHRDKLAFDPHPSRKGILSITEWMILVPNNPANYKEK